MTSTIGIPIKLLNEAQVRISHFFACAVKSLIPSIVLTLEPLQGHVVTLEITSGQVYRGKLLEGS